MRLSDLIQTRHASNTDGPADVLTCPECAAPMVRRNSRYGQFYGCSRYPQCHATHGCHRDGRPYGTPADKATREARQQAHEVFDQLWKNGKMSRSRAYRWMREEMGLSQEEAHIGKFNKQQCALLIELVRYRNIR